MTGLHKVLCRCLQGSTHRPAAEVPLGFSHSCCAARRSNAHAWRTSLWYNPSNASWVLMHTGVS